MPGLAGQVTPREPIARPQEILEALERVLEHPGATWVHRTFVSTRCVLSNFLTGILPGSLDQPAVGSGGDHVLFLEGEVSNLDELCGGARQRSESTSPAGLLLSLLLEQGVEVASRLDGSFNIALYEGGPGRLTLINDRFGSKPLYYLEEPYGLLFGSEKKTLLSMTHDPPGVDPLGVLQVFSFRHNLQGRTFLQRVGCLPPGSRLEYSAGRARVTRYHRFRPVTRRMVSERDLVEEGAQLLRRAVERRLRGKSRILMSLSGGLDSRAVACALPRDLRPMSARTRGFTDSADYQHAAEISRRLGFDHYREEPSDVPFSRLLPWIVWRTEGAVIFVNCMTAAHHAEMKERADYITGGYFGDVGSGAHIYPYMFLPGGRARFVERALRRYTVHSTANLKRVFRPSFVEEWAPLLRDSFIESFRDIDAPSNVRAYQIWELTERQARMTVGASPVDSHLFEMCYLMSDNDYMDFCLSLGIRGRFGRSFYQAMIHRLGPELRDIPNGNTGRLLRPTIRGNLWSHLVNLGEKGSTKLIRKVRPGFKRQRLRVHLEGISSITRTDAGFREFLEDFLDSDDCDDSIFDPARIRGTLRAHLSGEADHAHLLCLLATFAASFRFFVGKRPKPP
jgi:asparagine synthase (glutamine-hydrolysing)